TRSADTRRSPVGNGRSTAHHCGAMRTMTPAGAELGDSERTRARLPTQGMAATPAPRFRAEYLIEAALLGIFMISACAFTVLLEYSSSPVHEVIASADIRRFLFGLDMGITAVLIILCPWGMLSGDCFNLASTLKLSRVLT